MENNTKALKIQFPPKLIPLVPVVPDKPVFFTGWHQPVNGKSGCKFRFTLISINVLLKRKSAFECEYVMIDSGAFTRISGRYQSFKSHLSTKKYAEEVRFWYKTLGEKLIAVVSQDYMCETLVLQNTGLTVSDHQKLTIVRYDNLLNHLEDLDLYIIPVIQGYQPEEYINHIYQYGDRLNFNAWVGVGSVCKRNKDPSEIYDVLSAIKSVRPDLRLHGFGLKKEALQYLQIQNLLYSADSAAAGLWKGKGSKKYVGSNDPQIALEYEEEIIKSFISPKTLPAKQLTLF